MSYHQNEQLHTGLGITRESHSCLLHSDITLYNINIHTVYNAITHNTINKTFGEHSRMCHHTNTQPQHEFYKYYDIFIRTYIDKSIVQKIHILTRSHKRDYKLN